jgi:hypothetical protein
MSVVRNKWDPRKKKRIQKSLTILLLLARVIFVCKQTLGNICQMRLTHGDVNLQNMLENFLRWLEIREKTIGRV